LNNSFPSSSLHEHCRKGSDTDYCERKHDWIDTFGEVRIGGSGWVPPQAKEVADLMKGVVREYADLKRTLHPLELAAWLHNKIARVHPFTNGRTARLAMNVFS
jgi:Fic family protein